MNMGPGYFVIAILGCADGGSACTPVATLPARFTSQSECVAAAAPALEANSAFDFPTLLARCNAGSGGSAENHSTGRAPAMAGRAPAMTGRGR